MPEAAAGGHTIQLCDPPPREDRPVLPREPDELVDAEPPPSEPLAPLPIAPALLEPPPPPAVVPVTVVVAVAVVVIEVPSARLPEGSDTAPPPMG